MVNKKEDVYGRGFKYRINVRLKDNDYYVVNPILSYSEVKRMVDNLLVSLNSVKGFVRISVPGTPETGSFEEGAPKEIIFNREEVVFVKTISEYEE